MGVAMPVFTVWWVLVCLMSGSRIVFTRSESAEDDGWVPGVRSQWHRRLNLWSVAFDRYRIPAMLYGVGVVKTW